MLGDSIRTSAFLSDASGDVGYGAHTGSWFIHGIWRRDQLDEPVPYKELYAVKRMLRAMARATVATARRHQRRKGASCLSVPTPQETASGSTRGEQDRSIRGRYRHCVKSTSSRSGIAYH